MLTSATTLRLVRLALQLVLFLLLLSTVIAVASDTTGTAEKVALVGVGLVLVWAAAPVRRIGRPNSAPG